MSRVIVLGVVAAIGFTMSPSEPAFADARDVKCDAGAAMLTENEKTYSDMEVDVLAKPKKGNKSPTFPSILLGSATYDANYKDRVSGEVIVRFVVDTLGCVDMRTFTVVSANDSAFTNELLKVLPKYRYEPAKKDGARVRAWLTWKFLFYKDNSARAPGTK